MSRRIRNLRLLSSLAGLLPVLVLLPACQSEKHEELQGGLYFGAGDYLAQLELHNGNVNIVTSLGDVEIREISPQDDERLLLTVFGRVDQQDKHSLVLFDLDTKQTLTIAYGRNGHYLPGSRVLVYDDGVNLILAQREDDGWQKTEIVSHAYNAALRIMPISSTRFLYQLGGQAVFIYDTVSRRSIELSALSQLCRLDAGLWDMQREQFLCRRRLDDSNYEYIMFDLDGTERLKLDLPGSRMLQPLAFLPDQDALVLTERRRSRFSDRQNHAVWVLRFDTGEFYRLLENQYLGRSVVYAR